MTESLGEARRRRRLSYTTRARITVAFSPILLPLAVVFHTGIALGYGLKELGVCWWEIIAGDFRWWYRNVWRPARYGSSHDY